MVFVVLLYLRYAAHVPGRRLALLTIVMSATMLFWLRTVESSLAGFLG